MAVSLAILLATPSAALPDAPAGSPRLHYERAQGMYQHGRLRETIVELKRAYLADPQPILLLNIAHCYRALGETDAAIPLYRRFLEKAPADANRAEVEDIVRDLDIARGSAARSARADVRPEVTAPRAPSPAATSVSLPGSEPPGYRAWYGSAWFWAGVAMVVTGAAAGVTWARRDPACPAGYRCR